MTQASLSPDPPSPVATRPVAGERPGISSEAALWLFGLVSLALVLASMLLLGLLAQDAVADAPLAGFLSATAVVIASLGVAAMVYVVVTARRAGYIRSPSATSSDPTLEMSDGLRVVPVTPVDPGPRKRRQHAQEQAVRSRQARAIAAVDVDRQARAASSHRAAIAPAPTRVAPRAPLPLAPVPKAPAPVRPAAGTRPRVTATAQPPAHAKRPTPAPVFPRMPAPVVRPRTQVARTQVVAADIRPRSVRPVMRPPVARPPVMGAPRAHTPVVRLAPFNA